MPMSFYLNAPLTSAESAPSTDAHAKPTRWVTVSNAAVLKVKKATYRNAVFEGAFLLDKAETEKHTSTKEGWHFAIVYCLWFGGRLQPRGLEWKYHAEGSEVREHYTGEVVSNLSL